MVRLTLSTLCAFLGLVALLAVSPAPARAQPPLAVCGDCDGDFDVDVVDARVAWLTSGPVGLCDTNLSGVVNLADALAIARFAAGAGSFLWCPAGIPSFSRIEPFTGASGNCFNGVSSGAPFRFRLFSSNPAIPDSVFVSSTGITRGSSAFTMAAAVSALVPAPYSAAVVGGSCVVFLDPNGSQAHLRIFAASGAQCIPDLGRRCLNVL